jgi:simple sugar transport system permease protein
VTSATPAPGTVATLHPGRRVDRQVAGGAVLAALGLLDLFGFGLGAHSGDAAFGLSLPGASVHVPDLRLPAMLTAEVAGVVSVALGVAFAGLDLGRGLRRAAIALNIALFVLSLLCWADAGKTMSLVGLIQSTVQRSIPLVLGALAGCLCERSGVINIAIEGQLLLGAFCAAIAASAAGLLWLGLVCGSLAGGLLGALLAVFAIRYLVDQVVLGVVLNVLASGLTGYLYDRALIPYQATLNSPAVYGNVKIPGLSAIPIVGPVLFDSSIFLYLTYGILLLVQAGLFHTRWGLRVRAVGEHPLAAETVGIRVLYTRYRNVILGGLVAGVGGAYLTIGSVGPFGKDISSGKGYIALAAMIFGRWTPVGAVGAALLFGFADALQNILSVLSTPIPSDVLLMLPYVATIVVVAGLVGQVRAPRADGKPYTRQ